LIRVYDDAGNVIETHETQGPLSQRVVKHRLWLFINPSKNVLLTVADVGAASMPPFESIAA